MIQKVREINSDNLCQHLLWFTCLLQTDRQTDTPKQTHAHCYHTVGTVTHTAHTSQNFAPYFSFVLLRSPLSVLLSSFIHVLVSFFMFLFRLLSLFPYIVLFPFFCYLYFFFLLTYRFFVVCSFLSLLCICVGKFLTYFIFAGILTPCFLHSYLPCLLVFSLPLKLAVFRTHGYPGYKGSRFLWNVCTLLSNYTASHLQKLSCQRTPW